MDIIEMLKIRYRVQDIVDYSGLEPDGLFLEGTGAMVLDHIDRVAYTARSDRANSIALERFCTQLNFEPMVFDAYDAAGVPIYHTNVLMTLATEFALVSLDMIPGKVRRREITHRLERSGREIIDLTPHQIMNFSGNALELQGNNGRFLALSATAFHVLTDEQIVKISRSVDILKLDLKTIEKSGGSVRCTLAGIHLSPR